MSADSFKSFHRIVYPYIEAILAMPENQDHPFKGEWQSYKDCERGISIDSTWHTVKNIMNLKSIDDYRRVITRCPNLGLYLQVHRSDQRFNSRLTYKVLKPVPLSASNISTESLQDSEPVIPRIHHLTKPSTRVPTPREADEPSEGSIIPDAQPQFFRPPPEYRCVTNIPGDQSFEQFYYQLFPEIVKWISDPNHMSSQFSEKWNIAITKGLNTIATWDMVSNALGITDLYEFYTLIQANRDLQQVFDLIWSTPTETFYYKPAYTDTTMSYTAPSSRPEDSKHDLLNTTLQQKYDAYAASMDATMAQLQEKISGSATRMENFIGSYTVKLQNMSHDIAMFNNTIDNRTAIIYDKITAATNKALADIRASIPSVIGNLLQEAQQTVNQMTEQATQQITKHSQDRLAEADRIYDDLVEEAVATIYDTTQDVLDQITDHHTQLHSTPALPRAPMTTRVSAESSHQPPVSNSAARFPTPWSRNRSQPQAGDGTQASPVHAAQVNAQPSQSTPHQTPSPITSQQTAYHPVTPSPIQLDHQKFIKYVDVTYRGNIFAFYNMLQNFSHKWGLALLPLDEIRYGQSLCPAIFNGAKVSPPDYQRMASALYEKLQSTDCIPTTYTALRHTLNRHSSTYDGYKALYDILEDYIPRLKKDPVFPQPLCEHYNTIHEYADQFEAFLTFERLSDPPRIYSPRDQIRRFIANLGPKYSNAVSRLEILMDAWHDPDPPPPMLELQSLPKTIQNYNTSNSSAVLRAARAAANNSSQYNHHSFKGKTQPTTPAANPNPCEACSIVGHTATECNAWAKFLILSKFNRTADESTKSKAITSYLDRLQTPKQRQRRTQMKATIRSMVEQQQIDEILALIPFDEGSDDDQVTTSHVSPFIHTDTSEE